MLCLHIYIYIYVLHVSAGIWIIWMSKECDRCPDSLHCSCAFDQSSHGGSQVVLRCKKCCTRFLNTSLDQWKKTGQDDPTAARSILERNPPLCACISSFETLESLEWVLCNFGLVEMLSWSNDVDCVWTPFLTAFGIWLEPWIILLVVVVVIIIIITKRNRSSTNNDEQPKTMSCPEHILFEISWIQFDISVLSIQTNVARCSEIQRYMWRYQDFYRRHRFAHTKRKGGWDVGSPSWFQLLISIKKTSLQWPWILEKLLSLAIPCRQPYQPTANPWKLRMPLVAKAVRHAEILAMGTVRDSPSERSVRVRWLFSRRCEQMSSWPFPKQNMNSKSKSSKLSLIGFKKGFLPPRNPNWFDPWGAKLCWFGQGTGVQNKSDSSKSKMLGLISLVGTFQSFQLMGIVWVFNAIYGFGRKATFGWKEGTGWHTESH